MAETIYRPGLEGIIAGKTAVCSVEQVGLWYRGYSIEQLAEHASFEEVVYLLYYGDLPNRKQLDTLRADLDKYRVLPDAVVQTLRLIPKDANTMDVMRTAISMAGHFTPIKGDSEEDWRQEAIRQLSVAASALAARYRIINGKEPVAPKKGLSHAEQLLYQFYGESPDRSRPSCST